MSETLPATTGPSAPAPPARKSSKLRCWVLTILLLGAAIFEMRVAFLVVPNIERLLSDMLVDNNLLSPLTRFIMEASRFQARHIAVLFSPLLVIVALLWWRRGAVWISTISVTLTLLLAGLGALAFPAMLHATATVLHNLRDVRKKFPPATKPHEQTRDFLNREPQE